MALPRHRVDRPCHLELFVGLLVQFKRDVEVLNGDKVAISEAGDVVVNWGREQSRRRSSPAIPPGIIRCRITGNIFRTSSFWVGVPCHDSTSSPLTVAETLPMLQTPAVNDSRQSFAWRISPNIRTTPPWVADSYDFQALTVHAPVESVAKKMITPLLSRLLLFQAP
jgi:hypothetical protein